MHEHGHGHSTHLPWKAFVGGFACAGAKLNALSPTLRERTCSNVHGDRSSGTSLACGCVGAMRRTKRMQA